MVQLDYLAAGYFRQMRQRGLLDIPENMVANVSEADFRKALARIFILFKDRLLGDCAPSDKITEFKQALARTFSVFKDRAAGDRRWFDKTVNAEAIGALPYVLSVWPRAKIIYLARNGISNMISAERHFGVNLRDACLNWASCGEQWDRTRPELPAGSYVGIKHEDLVHHCRANRAVHRLAGDPPCLVCFICGSENREVGE